MSEFPYPAFADHDATIVFQDGSIRIEKLEYMYLTLMTGISFLQRVNSFIFDFQVIIVQNQLKSRMDQNNMVCNLII